MLFSINYIYICTNLQAKLLTHIKLTDMRKLFVLAMAMVIAASSVFAQDSSDPKTRAEVAKERAQIAKLSKQQLNDRASKAARKAVKDYEKEGWKVAPGHLPLDKQLDRSYKMQYEYDNNYYPMYVMGEAMSIAESYDAAKMQATELAKINLAGQMQTEVTAMVEASVANNSLPQEEAASITEVVMASKSIISQNIGRIVPVIECYRDKPNKNKELRVVIAYNSQAALEAAKKAIRSELAKKSEKLAQKLDEAMSR